MLVVEEVCFGYLYIGLFAAAAMIVEVIIVIGVFNHTTCGAYCSTFDCVLDKYSTVVEKDRCHGKGAS